MATAAPDNIHSQYDPGKIQTDIGFYETLFRFHDQKAQHCIPAIVKSYDRSSGIVTVQPLVQYICTTDNGDACFSRPEYKVGVRRICCGGFTIDVPLFIGDTGWLIAGDRNAETAKFKNSTQLTEDQDGKDDANEGEQPPNDRSLGDFAWGFFLPDYWGNTNLSQSDGLAITCTPKEGGEGKPFRITAGDLNITLQRGNEDDESAVKITLDDDGLHFDGNETSTQSYITDIRYDKSSHQFQKKTIEQKMYGDFVVGVGEESNWTMISGGQAVPERTSEA